MPLENECPWCHKFKDQVTVFEGKIRMPIEGDYSLCPSCGKFSRFGPRLELIPFPDGEIPKLPAVDQVQLASAKIAWCKAVARNQ